MASFLDDLPEFGSAPVRMGGGNARYRENLELAQNPHMKALLHGLSWAEGTADAPDPYRVTFGGAQFDDLSQHPNIQRRFVQTDGKVNSSGAAGKYQFTNRTWNGVASALDAPDFGEDSQTAGAVELIRRRGALDDVLNGNLRGAVGKLGNEWASLPTSPYPQRTRSWGDLEKAFEMGYGMVGGPAAGGLDSLPVYDGPSFEPQAPAPAAPAAPKKRTWGQAIGDTAVQVAEGVNTLGSSVVGFGDWAASLAGKELPNLGVKEQFDSGAEYWRGKQSQPMQDLLVRADAEVQAAEAAAGGGWAGVAAGIKTRLGQMWDNPALAGRAAATTLPSIIPSTGAVSLATRAGLGVRGALAVGGGVNAALNSGDAYGEAYDRIYKTARKQGMSDEEATSLATQGAQLPAAIGFVTGIPGGMTGAQAVVARGARGLNLGGRLAKGGVADVLDAATDTTLKTALKRGGGAAMAETLGEIPEETLPLIAANRTVGQLDGKTDWAEGVGRTVVDAAAGAGPMSTYAGGRQARQGMRDAAQLKAALEDPNTPEPIRAQARDIIAAEAQRQGVQPDEIDTWLDEQFMADDARQADLDAEQEREDQYNTVKDENRARRWSEVEWEVGQEVSTPAENTGAGLMDSMAPENALLGAIRSREERTRAAEAQREDDRQQAIFSMSERTDPVADVLAARRQDQERAAVREAEAEEAALIREMNRPAPADPLVDSPNAAFMAAMGRNAAQETALQPAPVQQQVPAPQPQTPAQQVASREAERNQRARTEFGILKTQALATFAEIDDMYVEGLLSEGQYNVMAGMLAGDAVRLAEVRSELANIKNEAQIAQAEAAQMQPMTDGTPPSQEALNQIVQDLDPTAVEDAETAEPARAETPAADTRTRGAKFVDELNQRLVKSGKPPLLSPLHKAMAYLAMGLDFEGNDMPHGARESRSWGDVATMLSTVTGKQVNEKSVSKVMLQRGISQDALKSLFVDEVEGGQAGRVQAAADMDQQATAVEEAVTPEEEAATESEAERVQREEDAAPGQREDAGEAATETDTDALDAARAAERANNLPNGFLDENETSPELAKALNYNLAAIRAVPDARENWAALDVADHTTFDDLTPREQAKYVTESQRLKVEMYRDGATKASRAAAWDRFVAAESEIVAEYPFIEDVDDQRVLDSRNDPWADESAVTRPDEIDGGFIAAMLSKLKSLRGATTTVTTQGEGAYKIEPAIRATTGERKALFAAVNTLVGHPTLAAMSARAIRGLTSIGLYTPANNSQRQVNGFFSRNRNMLALNMVQVQDAANNPTDATPSQALAGTLAHELGHKADRDAGQAVGLDDYATTAPKSPFYVGVSVAEGGKIGFTFGPVASELFEAYQAGQLPQLAQAFLPIVRLQGIIEDTYGKPESERVPAGGGRVRGTAPGVQDRGAGDGVAGSDGPAAQPGRRGAQAAGQATGATDGRNAQAGRGTSGPAGAGDGVGGRHHLRLAAAAAARTAAYESWPRMVEAMLVNPDALQEIAPQAHALTVEAVKARTDEELGALLSGEVAAPAPRKPAAKKTARRADPAKQVEEIAAQRSPLAVPRNETPQQTTKRVDGAVKDVAQYAADTKNWALLKGGFTLAIANVYKKHLPSLERYVALTRRGQADRTAAVLDIDGIIGRFHALKSADERSTKDGSVNALLKESTRDRKWAFVPDWLPKGSVQVDQALATKYNRLSPEGQRVVREVFKHGHDATLKMRQQALDSFAHESDALIEQYRKQGNEAELRKAEDKKLRSVETFGWLADLNTSWPYAPLKRFGDHVVIARSKELMAQEAIMNDRTADDNARAAARKRVKEMRKDDKHYGVWFRNRRDSRKLAEEVRADARFADGRVENMAREDRGYLGQGDMLSAFSRLRDLVDNATDGELREKSSAALDRLMSDLHLTLLSEQSARQSGRRREDVLGADDDMMRAFDTQARAMANFTATLHNTQAIQESLADMRKEVRDNKNAGTTEERMDVFNEILRRHAMSVDTQTGPWNELVGKIMSGTSGWMLLTSISYHAINAMQPWAMSMPVMASRHGYGRAQAALMKAYKDVAPLLKDGRIAQDDFSQLPADVRDAVQQLADEGVIMISLTNEMGALSSAANPVAAKVAFKLHRVAQMTEAVNRLSTAIAAVRLQNQQGITGEKAVAYAREIIDRTHGEYASWNAPRVMNTPVGRLATQFRKFQLIQLSLWTRMVRDSFVGESAEVRREARLAAMFSLGHMGVLGGMVGMPGFQFISLVLGAMFGSDDEPWDTEEKIREGVGDDFMGMVVRRGLFAAMGADIAGRAGSGDMLSILPYTDATPSKEGYQAVMTGLMGPFFGGLLPRMADGMQLMNQGQFWKGSEAFMPKGLADLSRSVRQESQGLTNRKGDVLLTPDDLSIVDSFLQGIGVPPTTTAERGRKAGVKYLYEQHVKDRSSQLQREYTAAVKDGDGEARAEVMRMWVELQANRRSHGFQPQPVSTLIRAAQAQAKREQNTIGGIQFNRQNRQYVERLVGADQNEDDPAVEDEDAVDPILSLDAED